MHTDRAAWARPLQRYGTPLGHTSALAVTPQIHSGMLNPRPKNNNRAQNKNHPKNKNHPTNKNHPKNKNHLGVSTECAKDKTHLESLGGVLGKKLNRNHPQKNKNPH